MGAASRFEIMKILRLALLGLACVNLIHAEDKEEPVKPPINPDMVKAEVFKKRYARVGMAETMHTTAFFGVQEGVAILKVGDMNPLTKGWREKWIGVKLQDLDPAFRAEVEKAAAVLEADAQLDPAQKAAKQKKLAEEQAKQRQEAVQKLLEQQGLGGAQGKKGD